MKSFRLEPFLWIHLAGIALAPLALIVVWLALAVGTPLTPYFLELGLLAITGIGPILWMQWRRPFEIFSILLVALRPENLTEDQRRILSLFLRPRQRGFALLTALLLLLKLGGIYFYAPLAAMVVVDLPQIRVLALLVAAGAFLGANLFIQVPVSVLSVLLTSETNFRATPPLNAAEIREKFTIPGWQVKNLSLALDTDPVPAVTMKSTPADPDSL